MNKTKIGKRIKAAREKVGLSQEQLAEKANVSSGTISMIERGVRAPSIEVLVSIVNILDTTADLILRDVLKKGYAIEESELGEKIKGLSATQRKQIYHVVETMVDDLLNKNDS